MRKIICIGECVLDIIFKGSSPAGAMPGGRIANASAILAREGLPVKLVSELAAGSVGDMIASFLTEAGVDCSSVDRFTEGLTPVSIFTTGYGAATGITRYEDYPEECFDVVWPRIDEGDIVVFGGFYAVDSRMRSRMSQLLAHASERKAVMVYLPGYLPQQEPRVTRVMPALLENLEYADLVLARTKDLEIIFGETNGEKCHRDHVDFYCRSMINIDPQEHLISYYGGNGTVSSAITSSSAETMTWNAGAAAGVVKALFDSDRTLERLEAPDEIFSNTVISSAMAYADKAMESLAHEWQRRH